MSAPPSDPRPDDALVAALNRGDATAFDALYFRHRDWVLRLAHRFTGDADDAVDVVQETFSYLFSKFPGFVLSARLTTFLYPAVKNLSIAARKRRRRAPAGDAAAPEPEAPPAAGQYDRSELAVVLSGLPEQQREVLLMRFVDDMPLAEIAEALAIPVGTVKSRLHNALAVLKQDSRLKSYLLDD